MDALAVDLVLMHPLILGELAYGTPPLRNRTLADLVRLQPARQASIQEVMDFIEREELFGLGCGLIAITFLTPGPCSGPWISDCVPWLSGSTCRILPRGAD